jgi:AraC family transcriptional regulator
MIILDRRVFKREISTQMNSNLPESCNRRDSAMPSSLTERSELAAAEKYLLASTQQRPAESHGARPLQRGLETWRLHRVQAYIDAHISDPIRLADLAKAAGLSRMYFASQFRARMGTRPHEYLVGQRISRARILLKASRASIADVAFSVGFGNQAHFTTVFLRFTGFTPHRWRISQNP